MAFRTNIQRRLNCWVCLVLPWLAGCAAFHPMKGVPARFISDDLKVGQRNGKRTIDLSLLTQEKQPYLIDAGDTLGIYIGGVTGKIDENPPVQFPLNSDYQPAAGVPVTVREDGTISLPLVGALNLRNKSIREAEDEILKAYTNAKDGKDLLVEGRQRILVSLQRPRQTNVLVIRQDSRNEPLPNAFIGAVNLGTAKRGSGKLVSLPAYRNDVLNALVATDGIPGLDAENAVYVIRRRVNRQGNDPLWTGQANVEELIRNSKAQKKVVIRGQNMNGDQLQYPQPWDLSNGLSSQSLWTRDNLPLNPSNPYSPGPNPSPQQPLPSERPSFAQQPTPPTSWTNAPSQYQSGLPNAVNQQNWPVQQPSRVPPIESSALPVQGYSLPDRTSTGPEPFATNGFDAGPQSFDSNETFSADNIGLTDDRHIIRIPIRLGPDEHMDIKKEDIILHDGDIVFIESRDAEIFFTGGLLGGGQYTLPRDRDMNILEAISVATSRAGSGGGGRQVGGVSALNSDVTISPSNIVVLRKLPDGGQIPIKVDLYKARTDQTENIVIQPGDYLYLQFTPLESVAAFIERHLLEGALFGVLSTRLTQ